jgi:1-acyl-sn-glycerol-3-phosphate acyltransferase
VLLTRLTTQAQREILETPNKLKKIREDLETWEATIVGDYHLVGEYAHCTIFEVSDNLRAQRAVLNQEFTGTEDTLLLPAIDYDLFGKLLRQEIRTDGPHEWQIKWWAKLARLCFRWYQYDRWIWRYFKPLHITGRENFRRFKGNCIVVANHTSHFDTMALLGSLPGRIRWNIYMGAAADRWFLRNGGGRKELALQPWYNSMITGSFPIRRGGGSATLDYSKWLLDNGASLGIFPEGTRSTSRKMARFKHGVSILALEKGVPVVPVYLAGVAKIRPKGSRDIVPGPVYAHIQEPIHFEPGTTVPDATRMIYDRLNEPHKRVHALGDAAGNYNFVDSNAQVEPLTSQDR